MPYLSVSPGDYRPVYKESASSQEGPFWNCLGVWILVNGSPLSESARVHGSWFETAGTSALKECGKRPKLSL